MKKGMAKSGNLAMLAKTLDETTIIPRLYCHKKTSAVIPTLTAIGTPMKRRRKKRKKKRMPGSIKSLLFFTCSKSPLYDS
jgi:hypothetical protein